MIHYIIVKWNGEADKISLAEKARALYADAAKISVVNMVEIKENVIPRDNRYDLMIALHMDSNALTVWDNSDLHLKWKSDFGGFIEKKCIFDCEE